MDATLPVLPKLPPIERVVRVRVKLDGEGRIDEDLACRGCGYNLRTLALAAACPECGGAVGASAVGDLLKYSNPAWVGRVATGMRLLVAAVIVAVGLVVLNVAVSLIPPDVLAWETRSAINGWGTAIGNLALLIVSLLGVWRVTAAEPGPPEPGVARGSGAVARPLARYGIVLGLTGWLAMVVVLMVSEQPVVLLPMLLCLAGCGAGAVAMFVHLRKLALRLPDERLAGQTQAVMWAVAVSFGLGGVLLVAMVVLTFGMLGAANSNITPGQETALMVGWAVATLGACVMSVVCLVVAVWFVVLVVWYRVKLMAAAREARGTWAGRVG